MMTLAACEGAVYQSSSGVDDCEADSYLDAAVRRVSEFGIKVPLGHEWPMRSQEPVVKPVENDAPLVGNVRAALHYFLDVGIVRTVVPVRRGRDRRQDGRGQKEA